MSGRAQKAKICLRSHDSNKKLIYYIVSLLLFMRQSSRIFFRHGDFSYLMGRLSVCRRERLISEWKSTCSFCKSCQLCTEIKSHTNRAYRYQRRTINSSPIKQIYLEQSSNLIRAVFSSNYQDCLKTS